MINHTPSVLQEFLTVCLFWLFALIHFCLLHYFQKDWCELKRWASAIKTTVTQFILIGLSDLPEVRHPLFVVFTIIYQVTLVGNGVILFGHWTEKTAHTHVLLFGKSVPFRHLLPISYCPQDAENLLTEKHSISLPWVCFAALFSGGPCGNWSLPSLCHGLWQVCGHLFPFVIPSWLPRFLLCSADCWDSAAGFLNSLLHTVSTFRLLSASPNWVNQYYCDTSHQWSLSHAHPLMWQKCLFCGSRYPGEQCLPVIFISYFYIISTILKIQSAEGKRKAFSHMCFPPSGGLFIRWHDNIYLCTSLFQSTPPARADSSPCYMELLHHC